jgi:response regulator RpfG family c-di-GMP phosphodiesterase
MDFGEKLKIMSRKKCSQLMLDRVIMCHGSDLIVMVMFFWLKHYNARGISSLFLLINYETADKALRLAEKHVGEIRLLITVVVIPELNGQELAARMMKLSPNLKVFFMSGFTANVLAERGVLDEGTRFIQKPFSMKDLADTVHKALKQ